MEPQPTQYRPVGFSLKELKAVQGGWEFTGFASVFGNVDEGGDVVARGAFDRTLTTDRHRPLLWQHDMREPIGVEKSLAADEHGLLGTWKIVDTARGTDAYKLLKAGAIKSLSIGYVPVEVEYDAQDVRILKDVELYENSIVSMGMNPQALITQVKAAEAAAIAAGEEAEAKATWDSSYISNLPDSAFAVILDGGEKDGDGKTTPRSLRKLPHHDSSGAVDLPHLRNALSREPQTDMPASAHAKARAHLERHAAAEGIGDRGSGGGGGKDVDLPLTPATPLLTDLPLSEHAGIVQAELDAFVARIQDALSDLTDKGHTPTGAKRLVLEELLERCSSLDAVRSALTKTLAATATGRSKDGDPVISLNPIRRRLASARVRLLAEGILAAPTPVPAAN